MQRKLRTAARLTSKPLSDFDLEMTGFSVGKTDALDDRPRRTYFFTKNPAFADGYARGYSWIANNDMTGR